MAAAARSTNPALITAIFMVLTASAVAATRVRESYDVVHITFKLEQKVAYGQGFVITGNVTELGSWDVSEAPLMNLEGESTWYYDVDLVPGEWIEFKPVLVEYDTKKVICWRPGKNIVYQIGTHSSKGTIFLGTFECDSQGGNIKQVTII